MKHLFFIMSIISILLSGCTFADSFANGRAEFLRYVPKGEKGTPQDMQWLVQHDAGYGGYSDKGTPPGDLKVTNETNPGKDNGPGTYRIDWTFPDGTEYLFQLTISKSDSKGYSSEELQAMNDKANGVMKKAMGGSLLTDGVTDKTAETTNVPVPKDQPLIPMGFNAVNLIKTLEQTGFKKEQKILDNKEMSTTLSLDGQLFLVNITGDVKNVSGILVSYVISDEGYQDDKSKENMLLDAAVLKELFPKDFMDVHKKILDYAVKNANEKNKKLVFFTYEDKKITPSAVSANDGVVITYSVEKNNSGDKSNESQKNNEEAKNGTDSFNSQIAVIKSKGFVPFGSFLQPPKYEPDAQVADGYGNILYAWDAEPVGPGDGSIHQIFFFIGSKYLGTDTLKPHGPIKSITAGDTGSITVSYSVFKKDDPMCCATGEPFIITYHWNGSKLIASAPFKNQFPR